MASTHAVSRLRKNLKELETEVNRILQNPIQYRYDHELIIYQIRQKIAFIRKLLVLESGSSSVTKPECIEEIADRLSIIEKDFVDWATSQASTDEQEYEEKESYSMFVADVEEMVSRVTEEKFREGLEVILSKVNLEETDQQDEKETYSKKEIRDEFEATLSKANLEKDDWSIGNQDEDQEKVAEEHEHEDKETCYEVKIIEESEGDENLENIDGSIKGQEEDRGKVEQEDEFEERETRYKENSRVELEVIVSKAYIENIDREEDQEKCKEEHNHDKKETCCEKKIREEMAVNLVMTDLERIVSELIEKANKKEKRGGSWFRMLGAMGMAAVATVGLAIAIFGSVEESGYIVPT